MKEFPDWLYELATFETSKKFESEPPTLKKLKPLKPCEDCGDDLDEVRVVQHAYRKMPIPHLQKKCVYCGLYEHPDVPGTYITNGEYRLILSTKSK